MFYLSLLKLNKHNAQVQREISNPYEIHRTLSKAFGQDDEYKKARCLFRLEQSNGSISENLLVQSLKCPNWGYLRNRSAFLDSEPQIKKVDLNIGKGEVFNFRLKVNPTVKKQGKRHPLYKEEDQMNWLVRKAKHGGFSLVNAKIDPIGDIKSFIRGDKMITHFGSCFEGILLVKEPIRFSDTLHKGIGPAKGFGFGLLSIARL